MGQKIKSEKMAKRVNSKLNSEAINTLLKQCAQTGNWESIDTKSLSPKRINRPIFGGVNLLHVAAHASRLSKFPKHLISQEGLELKSSLGETVFHIAAEREELLEIPSEYLKPENLTKKNNDGNTPIHYAAMNGSLNTLPKAVLTRENFLAENSNLRTPLDFAVFGLKGYLNHADKKDPRTKKKEETIQLILSKLTIRDLKRLNKRTSINYYDKNCIEYIEKELKKRMKDQISKLAQREAQESLKI